MPFVSAISSLLTLQDGFHIPILDSVVRINNTGLLYCVIKSITQFPALSVHQLLPAQINIVISPTPCLNDWLDCQKEANEKMARAFFYTPSFPYEEKSHLFCSATFAIYCFKRQVGRTLGKNLEKHMYLLWKGRCRQTSFWYEIRMRVQNYLVNIWCGLRSARHWAIFPLLRHCPSLGWCSWQSSQRSLENHN